MASTENEVSGAPPLVTVQFYVRALKGRIECLKRVRASQRFFAPFQGADGFYISVPEASHKVLASGYLLLALSEQKTKIA